MAQVSGPLHIRLASPSTGSVSVRDSVQRNSDLASLKVAFEAGNSPRVSELVSRLNPSKQEISSVLRLLNVTTQHLTALQSSPVLNHLIDSGNPVSIQFVSNLIDAAHDVIATTPKLVEAKVAVETQIKQDAVLAAQIQVKEYSRPVAPVRPVTVRPVTLVAAPVKAAVTAPSAGIINYTGAACFSNASWQLLATDGQLARLTDPMRNPIARRAGESDIQVAGRKQLQADAGLLVQELHKGNAADSSKILRLKQGIDRILVNSGTAYEIDPRYQQDAANYISLVYDLLQGASQSVTIVSDVKSGVRYGVRVETLSPVQQFNVVAKKDANTQDSVSASTNERVDGYRPNGGSARPVLKTSGFLKGAAPETFSVQLRRFNWDGTKDNTPVSVGNVVVPEFNTEGGLSGALSYEPRGAVLHYGGTGSGHYAYLRKADDGKWWMCDDSRVYQVSDQEAAESMRRNAYVISYRLV